MSNAKKYRFGQSSIRNLHLFLCRVNLSQPEINPMRLFMIAALLAVATPAVADQAAADRYIAEQWQKIEALRASNAKLAAEHRAACALLGGVRIGLNAEGVRKSCWGKPARINTTATAAGTREQWVYGSGYVYLTDGLVTAIQTSR
jgi:hypothetical protein